MGIKITSKMKSVTENIKFYEAKINHRRYGKKKHFFKNQTNAILIDLKNKPQQKQSKYPSLFSLEKFNLLTWSASNHGNQLESSTSYDLFRFIKKLCFNKTKDKEEIHKIKLLTFPKIFGFGFNPLSVYFAYSNKGLLIHSIFEVRNTFGDMHHYVLRNINLKKISQKTSKKLFVSPFYPKKGNYKLFANHVSDVIKISVEYTLQNKKVFLANMKLKEIKFNNLNILKAFLKCSIYPGKIWINIHLQAFILWFKRVKLYKIPSSEKKKHSFGIEISKD